MCMSLRIEPKEITDALIKVRKMDLAWICRGRLVRVVSCLERFIQLISCLFLHLINTDKRCIPYGMGIYKY